ncbi:c-type cytochrome [Eudoraea adriatica]|uniref:c-type cytochrome n=1 Tax=Eudoraea adriatica TaxID=446681 RepID=UPI0004781A07|nr:cytochrome c [Eudoraea adriatica]
MKTFKIVATIGIVCMLCYSFTTMVQEKWVVPAEYVSMKNPTDPDVDKAIGKSLYSQHCKSCHGKEGYGDGPKAKDVEGDLGDFSSEEYQAQTDGELFYKTSFGREDMPEYTKKMPDDEDRWLIVNYMRTLAE